MQLVVILGTGGNCVDILDAISAINAAAQRPQLECIGFLDDDPAKQGTSVHGVPVLGDLSHARRLKHAYFVNGIGSSRNFWRKAEIIGRASIPDERLITIVHPSAQVSGLAYLAPGVVVLQNSVIAVDAEIGKHVMILPLCVVSHDARIGAYSTIAGGVCISGNVTVGEACYIGTRCAVREGVTLGDRVLCGMGSNVLHDVPNETVVVGNPARRLRAVSTS
jgi:sugar O-acyltransferase (sialic acid O-acetyltransferase NeuD family)